jgi:hypothetical protein
MYVRLMRSLISPRLSSLLAAVALLALPLRTVVACTMAPAASASRAAVHGARESHGSHEATEQDAGDPAPDEGHTACPDLANCASAVLPAAPVASDAPRAIGALVAPFVPVRPVAPVRALDPPPPKR